METDSLIADLAAQAAPVKRLRPPMWRASMWLGAVLALGFAAILAFGNMRMIESRARHPELLVELAGTFATGILATVAAFHLSLPDRSSRWALLPLPALAVWLAGSGAGCYRDWIVERNQMWSLGETPDCLMFILGFGLPLGVAMIWALRRALPLTPIRVAVTGGLGAAALAAFLLQFFHPFDVTFMDLIVHAGAVAAVVVACGYGGDKVMGT
jgi:hypothetical protein